MDKFKLILTLLLLMMSAHYGQLAAKQVYHETEGIGATVFKEVSFCNASTEAIEYSEFVKMPPPPTPGLPLQPGMAVFSCFSQLSGGTGSSANGDVLAVFDIRDPEGNGASVGTTWASGSGAYHHPTWINSNLGEIFGIALEEGAVAPDIFVSQFGIAKTYLSNILPGTGNSGGAVFRIDGTDGTITKLAELPNTIYTAGSFSKYVGLGQLVYNRHKDLLYVSNIDDGMIYVLNASTGAIEQTFNSKLSVTDIGLFTPYERMVFGLGYNEIEDRLYFGRSLAGPDTSHIYSIPLDTAGLITGTEVEEAEIVSPYWPPAFTTGSLISDITFSDDGTKMLVGNMAIGPDAGGFPGRGVHFAHAREYVGGNSTNWTLDLTHDVGSYDQNGFDTKAGSAGGVDYGFDNYDDPDCASNTDDAVLITGDALIVDQSYGFQISPQGVQADPQINGGNAYYISVFSNISAKSGLGDIESYSLICDITCSVSNIVMETCATATNGSFMVSAASSDPAVTNFEYSIDNRVTWHTSGSFTGLDEGNYSILVRNSDVPSCETCCSATVGCANESITSYTIDYADESSIGGDDPDFLPGPIDPDSTSLSAPDDNSLIYDAFPSAVLRFGKTLPAGTEVTLSLADASSGSSSANITYGSNPTISWTSGPLFEVRHKVFTLSEAVSEVTVNWTSGYVYVNGLSFDDEAIITCDVCPPCTPPILTALTNETICFGATFDTTNVATTVTNSIPVTYQWYDNNGTDNTGTAMIAGQTDSVPTVLPTAAGSYSYKVVAINTTDGACTAEQTVDLIINANPTVSVVAASPSICPGSSSTITATAAGGDASYTYAWTVPAGETDPGNVASFLAATAGTYTVIVTDGNTCTATNNATLTLSAVPTATAASTNATCTGLSANSNGTITLSGFAATDTYQFNEGSSFGAGTLIPASSTTIPLDGVITNSLANPPADQIYTIRIFNADGCFVDRMVTLNNTDCSCLVPTVNVTAPSVCTGDNTTIAATASGGAGAYTYAWTVPAGETDPGDNASFSAATAGTYTVTVTDMGSCSAIANATLTLNSNPTVSVTASSVCDGENTTITATASGGNGSYMYAWTVPAGETDSGNVASFSASTAGTYTVIVTDGNTCTATNNATLTLNANPTATVTATSTTCTGATANSDGMLIVAGFAATDIYQYNEGNSFNAGTAIPASAMTIPVDGVITNTLANPASAGQVYTVRIFNIDGCFVDRMVTLNENTCVSCSITDADLMVVACDDNNSIPDASDDYISFTLNPTGTDIGTGYTLTVSSGTITPTTANYGAATTFQLQNGSAGSGDVTVTITDGTESACTFDVMVTDPGSCEQSVDFPDFAQPGIPPCPISPCHVVNTDLMLGTTISADSGALADSTATGDNDDGILFPNDLRPGINIRLQVEVTNNTGMDAYVYGWADWNDDGDFDDTGEAIIVATYTDAGVFTMSEVVHIPNTVTLTSEVGMRFRISTDQALVSGPCGTGVCAPDGEVEDYLIQVVCPPEICLPVQVTINRN